jgi:hypothetical protein
LSSVADPNPGSGAFLTPGLGIQDVNNPGPESLSQESTLNITGNIFKSLVIKF